MKIKVSLEHLLLLSFLFGFLIAYAVPFKVDVFVLITDMFVKVFILFAPLIVFVIIFASTCSLQAEKAILRRIVKVSLALFVSLIVLSSIFASTVLSVPLLKQEPGVLVSTETYDYIFEIMLTSLSNPVFLAIVVGFITPFLFARTKHFHKILSASKRLHSAQAVFFKTLIRILPLICLSLGARLYYDLGRLALDAYLIAISLIFALGIPFLIILLLVVRRLMPRSVDQIYKYSRETFIVSLSIGASYIVLPLNLEIFGRHFKMDKRVRDFILTLGASLNRCGSVMGVLVVTFVSAIFNNYGLSWQQMLSLAIPVALLGFGSPGIHGGTLLVNLSMILQMLSPPNPEKFASTALALFVGGTTFVQVAVNTVTSGYVALLVNYIIRRTESGSNTADA